MKKIKVLVAALLSITVVLGGAIPSYAASTDVNIEVKATTMDGVSVTVPSTLPIIFNADGSNTLPTDWTIENKSTIAGIYLSEITLDAGTSDWVVYNETQDMSQLPADTKGIKFLVGKEGNLQTVNPTAGVSHSQGILLFGEGQIEIPSGETQLLSFEVERCAFRRTQASAKAFDMVLIFDFM